MQKTLYQNGDWRVIPLTAVYAVVGKDGKPIFRLGNMADAVQTVDDMASATGIVAHTSM